MQKTKKIPPGSTTTHLALTDSLPLTCTRAGTCCHGKMVWLNPWELARLAGAKGLAPRLFRDRYCEFGGIRLRFDNPPGWKGLAACSQYVPDCGCSVHGGRPLACRLYPLGRQLQGEAHHYIHRGTCFPCLEGCPEVVDLPHLTVAEYLAGQDVMSGETAQDEYLELMQRLADGAFALLLESGLAASGDRLTLRLWRELGKTDPELMVKRVGPEWIDRLMAPDIRFGLDDPAAFTRGHHDMLQAHAQTLFGNLSDGAALREASAIMMGLALHLACGLGANPAELAGQWIVTAKKLGACE
jgi:Fe-S-cluster containining protein